MSGEAEYKAPLLLSFSCPIKWESMEGDESVRSCESCACKVQNISDYSRTQIDELLARVDAGEKICVAFSRPKNPAVATVAPVSQESDFGAADWFVISNSSLSGLDGSREALVSPGVTRFSIALAASISLTYVIPNEHQTAYAQDPSNFSNWGPSAGAPAQSVKQVRSEKIPSPEAADHGAKETRQVTSARSRDHIRYRTVDSEMMGGAVAPNPVRMLVGDVGAFHANLADVLIFPLLQAFNNDVDQGHISVDKLANLANGYALCNRTDRARKCYSLLLEVGPKQNADPKRMKGWREQVNQMAPKEFNDHIKEYDASCAKHEYDNALECLLKANSIRKLSPELSQSLSWHEISTRMDSLQSKLSMFDKASYLQHAFDLFRDEKMTPELQSWIKSKRDDAVRSFGEEMLLSDKAVAEKQYEDSFQALELAQKIGTMDEDVAKQCDWSSLGKRMRQVLPHLKSSREWCATLLSKVEQKSRPPAAGNAKKQK